MTTRRFILSSVELGRVTLNDDPIGWDSAKKVFSRNMVYIGVFRKRTANLKFVGDGLQYLCDLNTLKGTEAVCNVTVLQQKDYEDAWELEFEGIAKLNPFDLEWEDDLAPTLSIGFEDSGFHNKFLSRVNTEINVGTTTSIEGLDIGEAPIKSVQIGQRVVQESNVFKLSDNDTYYGAIRIVTPPENHTYSQMGHVLPMVEEILDSEDIIQTPPDYVIYPEANIASLMSVFVEHPVGITLNYHLVGSGATLESLAGAATWVKWVVRIFHDLTDFTIFTDVLLFEITGLASDADTPFSFDNSGTVNFTLNEGEAFTVLFTLEPVYIIGTGDDSAYDLTYTLCDVSVMLVQNFNEYQSNCHYRHEFMKRLVQIITDRLDCFKSDVFGRIAIGYDFDGMWHNNVVMNGKQIRGFNEYPVWSFEKSFKSVRSIWNLGCGIEKIDNVYKVVIEDITYFFRGTISITLHNVRKVKRSIAEEFTFSEVKVGYDKAEYEQVSGLEEYNNKSTFSTFIKSDTNTLDLLSHERADGYGMEFARRKSKVIAGSEDTKYDEEVFTAMVYETTEGLLRTQRDENYDSVENIQSPESAINLDITPQRNLLRNGDWIKACVMKYPLEKLKFVSADRPTDLVSQRTGNVEVSEQSDVTNGLLKSSLWLNQNYMFEADISPREIALIEKYPNSLIKFSPFDRESTKKYYYGWIMEVTVGGKERQGTFVLLAANVGSDRLKISDPDGIYDRFPETPLPPTQEEIEQGFQYNFEKVFEA